MRLLTFVLFVYVAIGVNSHAIKRQDGPVEANLDNPESTTTTSPTYGIVSTCVNWYKAVPGDTCIKIVDSYGTFSLDDFFDWNPTVGSDCRNLLAGSYYCVGVSDDSSTTPTTLTVTSTTTDAFATITPAPETPWPTQAGMISTCTHFHKAVAGDTCIGIVNMHGTFSLADFMAWNPAVGWDCSALLLGYYYCVGVPGTATRKTTSTSTVCNGAPTPTQPGVICACRRWHAVMSGNTCASIEREYGISAADFEKWNPGVGGDCTGLWLGYNVCVGV